MNRGKKGKTFFLKDEKKVLLAAFRPSRAVDRKRFFFILFFLFKDDLIAVTVQVLNHHFIVVV